jgi:glycosyltransferase A (GT-A) superfamily protein (DUF2064 family)
LGPDHKGGAYLIGLSKVTLKKMFANLSWRTSQVIKQLKAFFLTSGRFKTFI